MKSKSCKIHELKLVFRTPIWWLGHFLSHSLCMRLWTATNIDLLLPNLIKFEGFFESSPGWLSQLGLQANGPSIELLVTLFNCSEYKKWLEDLQKLFKE